MNLFYLVCPIGLEEAVVEELREKRSLFGPIALPLENLSIQKGGIEIELPTAQGLALNYLLKTPTRILMRLKKQRCRDFPKLYKIMAQMPWRKYLVKQEIQWRISAKESRIINTDKAEKTCEQALEKYFQGSPLSKKTLEASKDLPAQKVFLRFDKDDLTISLDTSGELLHIRGGRPDRGKASLRENYAACLLTLLLKETKQKTPVPLLVDPMCGTGTFLNEALDFGKLLGKNFPFLHWKEVDKVINPLPGKTLALRCHGLDLEPKAAPRENLEIETQDLFASLPNEKRKKMKTAVLICNPPYGKRVKIEGDRRKYFERLFKQIETEYAPRAWGVLVPADIKIKERFDKKHSFNNNGIKVNFYIKTAPLPGKV